MSIVCNHEIWSEAVPTTAQPAFALAGRARLNDQVRDLNFDEVWAEKLKDCLVNAQADLSAKN